MISIIRADPNILTAAWEAAAAAILGIFDGIGGRGYFVREILRALGEPKTYLPETMKQMRAIGVDSLPLASLVAAFIGSVIALQTRYQLFAGIQLSVVGLIARQMVILELGPLLTGLVLAGRVGAQMTAEIGTMRVTEQIDALETLAYDPVAYLVVPRIIAGLIMLPVLTIYADAIGIGFAFFTSVFATGVHTFDFRDGLRLGYKSFQVFYSLLKADHVWWRDFVPLQLRGLLHGSRRRGGRAVDRQGRRDLVDLDPRAGCAHGRRLGPLPPGMKSRDTVLVGVVMIVAFLAFVHGDDLSARGGLESGYPALPPAPVGRRH